MERIASMEITRDTVAVITGGASGMGRSTALALARSGASVAIADLNEARIAETVAELEALGVGALGVRCDVSRPEDIANLRDRTVERFGRVDILMNNAGILPLGSISAMPLAEFERAMRVNFLAVVCGVQTFLPDLAARGQAHIVNTASMAGTFAYEPDSVAYNASKAAVISLTENLALGLAPQGIGVTCLVPGGVATNIMEQVKVSGEIGDLASYVGAHFVMRTADEVGEMVVAAIRDNTFFLPTNPELVALLARRAADPDGFVHEMQDWFAAHQPA
jgi:NAD(P)-dependent dehydrogenase (short-subunit alcohol dehydrogenase family)